MSEIRPAVVPFATLLLELTGDSKSPVTFRVKPDRRRAQMPFPQALERRIAQPANRLIEIALVARPLRAVNSA